MVLLTVAVGIWRSGLFKSVTSTQTVPGEKPVAVASKFTCLLPSVTPSLMVVIGISTNAAPAGMVTVAGNVASPVFEDTRFTISG